MCRAFLAIRLDDQDETVKNQKGAALNYMLNSRNKGNHDGFFAGIHTDKPEAIRELDLMPVMKWIDSTELTRVFHGHARAANRGGVLQKYVHGWTFRDYMCTHNGTVDIDNQWEQDANDSFTFYRAIFSEKVWNPNIETFVNNIKDFTEKYVTGHGVFFMTNEKNTIVLSLGREVCMNLINGNLLLLNSNNDIHEFTESVSVENKFIYDSKNKKDLGILTFTQESSPVRREYFDASVSVNENLSAKEENCLLIFDNETGKCIRKVKLDPKKKASGANCQVSGYSTPPKGTSTVTKKVGHTVEVRTDEDIEGLSRKYLNVKALVLEEFKKENDFLQGKADEDVIFAG